MSRTALTIAPPVMEARRWLEERAPDGLPLLNVSQAAPTQAPHPGMVAAMVEALAETDTHLYGPVLGLPALREAIAARWTRNYGGELRLSQVGITSGCNEAFAATISMLCGEGDEVILPTPFYFNHKMWLDMAGVETVPLPCGAGQVPQVARAKELISAKTRAIVLVSPNNPTGAEYPAETIGAFYTLCQSAGIALIIDETYRDFLTAPGAPHALFQDDGWPDTLIHLYSFSKAYRLTGHRIGAVFTSEARLAEIEKYLDT
ncbi:MAG: aminotransferase, partial [Pseudomonadota bacterium]